MEESDDALPPEWTAAAPPRVQRSVGDPVPVLRLEGRQAVQEVGWLIA